MVKKEDESGCNNSCSYYVFILFCTYYSLFSQPGQPLIYILLFLLGPIINHLAINDNFELYYVLYNSISIFPFSLGFHTVMSQFSKKTHIVVITKEESNM